MRGKKDEGGDMSHLSYMEKLTFRRGLEAGSGFGSGDTEEGVPNKEKEQQE